MLSYIYIISVQLTILILSLIWFILQLLARIWNHLTAVHTQTPQHTHTHQLSYIMYAHVLYLYMSAYLYVCVLRQSPRFDSTEERKLLISSRTLQSFLSTCSPPHTHYSSVLLCALCSLFRFRFHFISLSLFVDCLHFKQFNRLLCFCFSFAAISLCSSIKYHNR